MTVTLSRSPSKIVTLEQLAQSVAEMKADGKRVVQCHGVFDLLHVGHIRHFKEARTQGDALVVTLTPDVYVNKGPDRPAFTEALRAEAIAALDAVDLVAINKWPSAVETIKLVRPDVYAKGPDYKDPDGDVTGGITAEEAAIESVGGQIFYTEDITFSSSHLINRHFSAYSNEVNEYLAELRGAYTPAQITGALDSLRKMRILVVGEAIIDEYVYVDQLGKASKEPVLAMRYLSKEQFAGGSLAIANHVASFADEVNLVTFLGTHDVRERFIRHRLAPNVQPTFFYKKDAPTITKRRYIEQVLLNKLFEVYIFNDELIDDAEAEGFATHLDAILPFYDVVIVADFGHGIFTHQVIDVIQERAKFMAVNTQQNAANIGYHTISRYSRADYVCTNESELRSDARTRIGSVEPLILAMAEKVHAGSVMLTRGKLGALFFHRDEGWAHCPAFATSVTDRVGTGDAVLSWTAPMVAAELPAKMIAFVANVIGAQAAQIMGNRNAVDRIATYKFVEAILK
jgi:rfaE bifunctional protein nucleotidyltransferase chain/domain